MMNKKNHPYLLTGIGQGKEKPQASLLRQLEKECNRLLQTVPVPENLEGTSYNPGGWAVELDVIRLYSRNIQSLSLGCRFLDEEKYLPRAKQELLALCGWGSWIGRTHNKPEARGFALETGEACFAAAIGYDWLYSSLSETEREIVRGALISKGLRPYENAVLGDETAWWTEKEHNWNPVCHGGAACAALALIGEYESVLPILAAAKKYMPHFTSRIQKDGAWDEGTGYWAYGMTYLLYYGLCLNDATGDDYVLQIPGLEATGDFFVYLNPNGEGSGFSDVSTLTCREHENGLALLHILAAIYDKPLYRWLKERYCGFDPMDLLFAERTAADPPTEMDNVKVFESIQWAVMTTGLTDKEQIYVSLRSGDLAANHSHQDLNSFVLWALGEKFIVELDKGEYTEHYFDPEYRERIYPISTRAHNTILIGYKGQIAGSIGNIIHACSQDTAMSISSDCSSAYEQTNRFTRTITIRDRQSVTLVDDIRLKTPQELCSLLHTFGEAEAAPDGFVIRQNGKQLKIVAEEPERFDFAVTDNVLLEGKYKGKTEKVLSLRGKEPAMEWKVKLDMIPSAIL